MQKLESRSDIEDTSVQHVQVMNPIKGLGGDEKGI